MQIFRGNSNYNIFLIIKTTTSRRLATIKNHSPGGLRTQNLIELNKNKLSTEPQFFEDAYHDQAADLSQVSHEDRDPHPDRTYSFAFFYQ